MSTVYVTFSRSTSTRETENRGLEAVAMTVMRYRSSAGLTPFPLLLPRPPGGDEDHFVESEPVGDLTGRNEVAMVNGVEGATHHS